MLLLSIGVACILIVILVRSYRIRLREVEQLSRKLALRTAEVQAIANDLNAAQAITHIGSWVYDFATDSVTMSDETCRIFGLPEGSRGTRDGYLQYVHPDDLPALNQAIEEALKGRAVFSEHRIRIKDTERWICQRARVEFEPNSEPNSENSESSSEPNGKAVRGVGTAQDITARRRAEDELRIAATAFESHEGMLITDARMITLRVNAAFTRVTGYQADDIVGKTPRLLKSGRHDAAFYAAMWEHITATGSWQGEIWNRRKSGEIYPEWLTITAVRSDRGDVTHYVGTLTDISQRKSAEDEIRHLAFYDPLTQLPNRRLLLDRLQQAMASSARSGRQSAVMFLDLDNFKALNDSRGHDKGDQLLQHVAQRLSTCIREGDTVSRFGGDEFVVMLVDLSTIVEETATQAEIIALKILEVLSLPYDLGGQPYLCTASIGIALFSNHQFTSFELLKQADLAMYEAKARGHNTVRFYVPGTQIPHGAYSEKP
jgi:diguanylate cyclase (GGDEF)-like protein/PAS domain S-box-containing protein